MKRSYKEGFNEDGKFVREYNTKEVNGYRRSIIHTRIVISSCILAFFALSYLAIIIYSLIYLT